MRTAHYRDTLNTAWIEYEHNLSFNESLEEANVESQEAEGEWMSYANEHGLTYAELRADWAATDPMYGARLQIAERLNAMTGRGA